MDNKIKICALLTCFNRREATITCLDALSVAAGQAGVDLRAVLVDDASNDGTADAVSAKFLWVEVFRSGGDLFWARGMAQAQALAYKYQPDFYLWLNDDTHVVPHALQALLTSYHSAANTAPVIVVGSTIDRDTNVCTYGGLYAPHAYKIFNFRRLIGHVVDTECDAMNGNFVLVPHVIVEELGGIDPVFAHGMGDIDYAMRAREAGFKVISAPGWHGYCSSNPTHGTYSDTTLPLLVRWKKMLSRKGLPVKSWLILTSRHRPEHATVTRCKIMADIDIASRWHVLACVFFVALCAILVCRCSQPAIQ